MLDQGDIVLVPVPFTDLTSQKRRPVIIVSNDAYNMAGHDIVVVAMTSNPTASAYGFPLTAADLDAGQLNRPGQVRADKIFTLAQSIVVKVFGRVKTDVLVRIQQLIKDLTDSSP